MGNEGSMKRCNKCLVEYPYSEFRKQKSTRDGYTTYCKKCLNACSKAWVQKQGAAFKERQIQYTKNSLDKTLIYRNNVRAKRLGLTGKVTYEEWMELKKRYGSRCLTCGKDASQRTIGMDHITPLSKGGSNTIDNIQPMCRKCNGAKSTPWYKMLNYRELIRCIETGEVLPLDLQDKINAHHARDARVLGVYYYLIDGFLIHKDIAHPVKHSRSPGGKGKTKKNEITYQLSLFE